MRLMFTVWGGFAGERTPYEDLFIAGAELACRQHAESLAAFGHEVTFACLGPRERDERVNGVHLLQQRHPLAGQQVRPEVFWEQHFESIFAEHLRWLEGIVVERQIEAVYTRVLWPTGVLGHRLQQATGVGCAATVDDKVFVEQLLDGPNLLPASCRERWVAEMRSACEGLGSLIPLANHLGEELRRFTEEPAPCTIIPSGLDFGRFEDVEPVNWRDRFGIDADRKLVVCAARLDWPKRQDLLIEATATLVSEGIDVGLILLGTGTNQEKLEALAADRGVEDRTVFLGYQPNETIPASLLGADVICTPTEWEAFPIQLLEGLAADKPLIVSDAPPYDDLLSDQRVIPVCANEAEVWTAAIRETIGDLSNAEKSAARRAYTRNLLPEFSQEKTSRGIEAVLRDISCPAAAKV